MKTEGSLAGRENSRAAWGFRGILNAALDGDAACWFGSVSQPEFKTPTLPKR
jgi:hypothetical protein